MQNYLTRILEDNLKALIKPQYVDHVPKAVKGMVGTILEDKDGGADGGADREYLIDILELTHVMDRDVAKLSGGELQRFAIAIVAVQDVDIYMFDEPSS